MEVVDQNISWPGWKTVGRIGKGGFGAVYEIERNLFGEVEKAALKVISIPADQNEVEELRAEGYDDESITDTFHSYLKEIVNEYTLMKKMNGCANVVSCDDVRYVQRADGIGWDIFIRMELLTPLQKALQEQISEQTVIRMGMDLCRALMECKKHGIVHRDIKPQNILVSANGDFKLGDFGIAKTVEKTVGGTRIGTYKYMAPEVYLNRPYGAAVDLYSLGLVMYWMLNERRLPFLPLPPVKLTAQTLEESFRRRFSGEQIPPPVHGSRRLKEIVGKACAFDPRERYSNAGQMYEDLEKLLSGQPRQEIQLGVDSPDGTEADRTEITRPLQTPTPEGVPQKETAPTARRKKGKRGMAVLAVLGLILAAAGLGMLLSPGKEEEPVNAIHRYTYHVEDVSWGQAFALAREKGGHLVHIDSMEEWAYIVSEIEAQGYQKVNFLLGGRRDLNDRAYYWTDENNKLTGTPLNGEDAWCSRLWFEGEPTFEFAGNTECYIQMYKDSEYGWVWNDVIEDTVLLDKNRSGSIGYIVEYERTVPEISNAP